MLYLTLGPLKFSLGDKGLDKEISECFEKISLRHKGLDFPMCMCSVLFFNLYRIKQRDM